MNTLAAKLAGATFLSALLVSSPASLAQAQAPAPATGPWSEASRMVQRNHAMAGIMKEMVEEMSRMQEEMGKGESTPESRKAMAVKMKRMSEMMRRMSGLADIPTMKEPEMQRQFEQMRRQMDSMSTSHSMADPAKSR